MVLHCYYYTHYDYYYLVTVTIKDMTREEFTVFSAQCTNNNKILQYRV